MKKNIHILGASGSGTSTLAKAISGRLGHRHLDTDDYYWLPTEPPYTEKRPIEERIRLIREDMKSSEKWVLSGSSCGWGDVFIPLYDLVIFLYVPQEIRLERLVRREVLRYGAKRISPGGDLYEHHKAFVEWAAGYETGGMNERSLTMHNEWLKQMKCPVLRIEGGYDAEECYQIAVKALSL